MKQGIKKFFEYARLRHTAYHNKIAGIPRGQQSTDDVINSYSFCNVFRQLDKTTLWHNKFVRDVYDKKPEMLLATTVFRMFNRIEVGEAIFNQRSMFDKQNSFDATVAGAKVDMRSMRAAIRSLVPNGPHCTGAYIISTPPGYVKLDGVLELLRRFMTQSAEYRGCGELNWHECAEMLAKSSKPSMEDTWNWFSQFDYFGKFHSYEIVCDLRYTYLLKKATDKNTWANPGPGARRGLNRVHGRDVKNHGLSREELIQEMCDLLPYSRDAKLWPQNDPKKWPKWELREVEHTLCEFDKWCRTHEGSGRPRSVYR